VTLDLVRPLGDHPRAITPLLDERASRHRPIVR
jgi:hypothetical protein